MGAETVADSALHDRRRPTTSIAGATSGVPKCTGHPHAENNVVSVGIYPGVKHQARPAGGR
jgi:hypothetical protein